MKNEETQENKPNPFEFINQLSFHKEKKTLDETDKKHYIEFFVNKAFGLYKDTILHTNEMNMRPDVKGQMHWDYFLNAIPKRKRFSKWPKKQERSVEDDDVNVMMQLYNINETIARRYCQILSEKDLEYYRTLKEGLL